MDAVGTEDPGGESALSSSPRKSAPGAVLPMLSADTAGEPADWAGEGASESGDEDGDRDDGDAGPGEAREL